MWESAYLFLHWNYCPTLYYMVVGKGDARATSYTDCNDADVWKCAAKKEFTFDRHILRRSRALVFGLFVSAPEAAAGDKENDDGRVDGIDDDDHLQGQLLHRFVPTWFTSRRN